MEYKAAQSSSITLDYLYSIREAAQDSLNSLMQIKNLMDPGIMKTTALNTLLAQQKSAEFREMTISEIEYFEAVIKRADAKIKEFEEENVAIQITENAEIQDSP